MKALGVRVALFTLAQKFDLDLTELTYEFEERASIMEFEGGLTRSEAEAAALEDLRKKHRRKE